MEPDYPDDDVPRRRRNEDIQMGTFNEGYQAESLPHEYREQGPNYMARGGDTRIPMDTRRRYSDSHPGTYGDQEHGSSTGSRRNWATTEGLRDTAELLSQLPSRQFESLANDVANQGRKTLRHRRKTRRSYHGSLRMRDPDRQESFRNRLENDEDFREDFIDGLDGDAIRDMPTQLSQKKELRHMTLQRSSKRRKKPGFGKRMKYSCGIGWFDDTELYYGYYTDMSLKYVGNAIYEMKYAYLLTCGGYYILCLIILALSISRSYKKNYIEGNASFNFYYTNTPILGELAMPLCVSGINFFFPFIFSLVASIERYEKPRNELYVNMIRTMLLKASILGMLVYFWFHETVQEECWETVVGGEIYRLVLVDFIFILVTTFFMEFIRRLGTYYSPLLSLIVIIKFFIIFYVKAVSVLQNCRPSLRPWRAARSHTIFLGFLFVFFLLSAAAVTFGIIMIKPSVGCGPFRGKDKAYSIVTDLVDSWNTEIKALHEIINFISSPGFIAGVLVFLCVVTYYMRIVMVGHKEMVTLLKQQLAMEGRDKAYLLQMLQNVSRKNKNMTKPASSQGRLLSPGSVITDDRSPGGRRFVKTMAEAASAAGTIDNQGEDPRNRRRRDQNGAASSYM
ncbi:hypothetical protein KUTeg_004106 [Tegillarca granosa]|uniref:TMC domain-containing protein n=1 Tax=Tegillarca granosa TaxID=220873 RepID=A0ABQ9FRW2_TEGGR|nr:hypothetical protein KUTeg_004106 [Tegillarca granosa]